MPVQPVEGITGSALSLCLCGCLESVRAEGPREERTELPPCLSECEIRAGWLEASALASTAGAAVGDEEVSGSHEK